MGRPSKDQVIINQNPGKSAYELLMLGLSQSKFEELDAAEKKQPTRILPTAVPREEAPPQAQPEQPAKQPAPQRVSTVRAVPHTRPHQNTTANGMAWYISPDGKRTHMARGAAQRLSRKTKGSKII